MGAIRVLPEWVANKIAAGEVIERPASVVKELVENALDAGASTIEIEIQHGGRSLIRVSDDGCGMDRQDTELAFQRHATSKIASAEDLLNISSFGFRGEALPSIAAVSRCRLISRSDASAAGTEVVVEGGNLKAVQEFPCRRGTIVEVRDLFFNTPARRKFLKSETTELGHLQEAVGRLALAAPGVGFVLRSDGRTLLELGRTDRLAARASAVLGAEVGEHLLELEAQSDGVRLRGLVAKPVVSRGNRGQIHLFVNGRWVRSLPLSYALQAGYHGMLTEGRYPVAVLFVELDLGRIDVNVHPTKQEVRISNEPEVAQFIRQSVRSRLQPAAGLAPLPSGGQAAPAGPPVREYLLHDPGQAGPWGAVMDRPISVGDSLRVTRILGQIHRMFILAETEEGFVVVDQHAAHERVVFEALLRSLRDGRTERQMLFLEEILEVHPRQRQILTEALPLLTRLGFELEPFGEGSWLMRAYPAVFGEADPLQLIRLFLDQVEEGRVRTALEDEEEAVAALCACKSQSVKAGEPLELRQMQSLLARLASCEDPFHCPHGRPVFVSHSLSELERQFKRA
jgi:DNA mismatch repair protein MutL